MKRFLLLGDSITEQSLDFDNGGWALHLLSVYRRKADIIPRGFSGYNTRWILNYLQNQQQQAQTQTNITTNDDSTSSNNSSSPPIDTANLDLAIIFLGANDAAEEGSYQHVPLDEYKENLKQLCLRIKSPRIILVTPPPYSAEKYMKTMGFPRSTRCDERTKKYAEAVVEVSQSFRHSHDDEDEKSLKSSGGPRVACANINDLFREKLPNDRWIDAMSDGLHLGPVANKIVAEAILDVIGKTFPEISASNLFMLFPSHRVFDPTNAQNYVPVTKEEEEIMNSHKK